MSERGGLDGKSLAIVGAGFAGLTAAAFALEKTTAEITVFDAAPRPLWLQDGCANRWLHPGIYDWPFTGALEPCTALPVLNWRAGSACDVARQVRAEWDRIVATKGLLQMLLETEVKSVTPCDGKLCVVPRDGQPLPFDVVVLAVGFGLEGGKLGRAEYWNDSDGLDGIARNSSVLISGFGDGGLADVLRLCLPDIRQANLIELVRHVPVAICRELIEKDDSLRADGAALDQFYGKLRVESIIQHLSYSEPPSAQITLSGRGHLYGTGSAILNRFLVSQLRQARGDEAFKLAEEVVPGSLVELQNGSLRVEFGKARRQNEFQHVVLRWGPKPAYRRLYPLENWQVGEERRKHWHDMPQSLDRTRIPLAEVVQEEIGGDRQPPDFLAYESSSRRWCLILQPAHPSINWLVETKLALEACKEPATPLNTEPLVRLSSEVFADQAAIRSVVRALCAADIVVADVTGYDPSMLLLLGIRAAVRRGITLACTAQPSTPDLWQDLPFNLRELNLVSFSNQDEGQEALQETLRAGFAQSGSTTRYLDLPVYDYIREEPSVEIMPQDERVLLLRAFKSYDGARKRFVQARIRDGMGLGENARIESVIDQKSPRLAGQRLYEAIRHWQLCVVDLTWWRPNVMFELGVRLATHPSGTYCLIDEDADGSANAEALKKLKRFLLPFLYDLSTPSFKPAFGRRVIANVIQETAARHFRTTQDHYDEEVDSLLVAGASVTQGHDDPLQAVDIKPLYAKDNVVYGQRIRHSAFEKLCAAWCYLADRKEPHKLRPIDLLDEHCAEIFRHFFQLGSRLKAGLAFRRGPLDKSLRQRIGETEGYAKNSGASEMAELLATWRNVRSYPFWGVETSKMSASDWNDFIDDCETQIQQLADLETRLDQLASPACQLPLEGVRSDLRRIERAVIQFKGRVL